MELTGSPQPAGEEPQGWLLLSLGAVPERWRHRAVELALIPLLPEEASRTLAGVATHPAIDPEDASLARLLARGLTIEAIAREMDMSVRGVQHRLARLRERLGLQTTAELRALFARSGFGAS